jgi:hypothetical protein
MVLGVIAQQLAEIVRTSRELRLRVYRSDQSQSFARFAIERLRYLSQLPHESVSRFARCVSAISSPGRCMHRPYKTLEPHVAGILTA